MTPITFIRVIFLKVRTFEDYRGVSFFSNALYTVDNLDFNTSFFVNNFLIKQRATAKTFLLFSR